MHHGNLAQARARTRKRFSSRIAILKVHSSSGIRPDLQHISTRALSMGKLTHARSRARLMCATCPPATTLEPIQLLMRGAPSRAMHHRHAQGLGSSQRFFYENGVTERSRSPGPGAYEMPATCGRQLTSDKLSYPSSSFPRADRHRTATTVYMGPKHKNIFWGKSSPGPAADYALQHSVGPQPLSQRPNGPKCAPQLHASVALALTRDLHLDSLLHPTPICQPNKQRCAADHI